MSLTSYRAAPPRDPKDRHHIALTFAARKCYYEQSAIQTVGEENGGWPRPSAGKAGGHRGIAQEKQGWRRNWVQAVPWRQIVPL